MAIDLPPVKAFKRLTLPSKRHLMLAGGALVIGYFLWWLLLWVSFSEESVRDQTLAALEQALGHPVRYTGETAQFSLLPTPRLVLDNVSVANHKRSREPSMLRMTQMEAQVSPFSLFGSELVVRLKMTNPRIETEHFDDGSPSWAKVPATDGAEASPAALIAGIDVNNGYFRYQYPIYGRDFSLDGIYASIDFKSASAYDVAAGFSLNGTAYELHAGVAEEGENTLQVTASLSDTVSNFGVSGAWNGNTGTFSGEQTLETADLGNLLTNLFMAHNNRPQQLEEPMNADPRPVLPLQWRSKLTFQGDQLRLEDIAIGGDFIQGGGAVTTQISDTPVITAAFNLEKFSLQPLSESGVLYALLTQKASTEIVEGYSVNLPEGARNTISKGISIALTLKSKESTLLGVPVQGLQLGAALKKGAITLSQFSGKLAGDSQFVLKGLLENNYDGIALKGQLDVAGERFSEFFAQAVNTEISIPRRLKKFRGRANVFLTPELLRLSEGIFRVANLQLLGTVIREQKRVDKDQPPVASYEGALRIDNFNLDELHNVQKDETEGPLATYPKIVRLAKKLTDISRGALIDLKVNLLNYNLNSSTRPKAKLEFKLNSGGIALNDVEADYNDTHFMGGLSIAFPPQEVPEIEADIRADAIDTARLFEHDFLKDENFWRDENGRWSRKQFQLDWMRMLNGSLKLQVGKFTHEVYDVTNMVADVALRNAVFQLNSLEGMIWGGKASLRGQVTSGKLPSMSAGYMFKGIQIEKLRTATNLVGDLIGNVSISGDLLTNGVNPTTFVQNAQGTVAVAGSGITVTGFNLANMVRAANTVRTVDDIQKLISFADQGGTTTIDLLQGNVTIGGSYLRSPGIMVRTREGSGSINMQLNLMDWTLNAAITIYLTALQQRDPPSIRLVFAGPLNQAARSLDTQSLESFIAKQAAERILETQ